MRSHIRAELEDGRVVHHALRGERITVGSGRTADIQFENTELDAEHLLLVPTKDGCWVGVAQDAHLDVLRGNDVFHDGLVPWDGELTIGDNVLTFRKGRPPSDGKDDDPSAPSTQKKLLPVIVAVVALLFVAMIFRGRKARSAFDNAQEHSQLFDAPVQCTVDPSYAESRMALLMETAKVHEIKYHFDYQEGIAAVRMFEEAADCARIVGRVPVAREGRQKAESLRGKMETLYSQLRLILRQSTEEHDDKSSLEAINSLRELLKHRDDKYTQSLDEHQRVLLMKLKK